MTYRDENERLRVRVAELEADLDAARNRIAHLEGQETGGGSILRRVYGGPSTVEATRKEIGRLDDETAEGIIEALSSRYRADGRMGRVGRRLTWTATTGNRMLEFTVVDRGDELELRGRERLGGLLGAIYGGFGGGVGGGGAFIAVLLGRLVGIPEQVALPIWFLLVLVAARAIFVRVRVKREREMRLALEDVARTIGRVRIATEKLRIEASDERAALDEEAELEAVAATASRPS